MVFPGRYKNPMIPENFHIGISLFDTGLVHIGAEINIDNFYNAYAAATHDPYIYFGMD